MEGLISKNYLSLKAARKSGTGRKLGGFSFSFTCILSHSNTEVAFSITANVQIDYNDFFSRKETRNQFVI